jgi:hypothetical protein
MVDTVLANRAEKSFDGAAVSAPTSNQQVGSG